MQAIKPERAVVSIFNLLLLTRSRQHLKKEKSESRDIVVGGYGLDYLRYSYTDYPAGGNLKKRPVVIE